LEATIELENYKTGTTDESCVVTREKQVETKMLKKETSYSHTLDEISGELKQSRRTL